MSNSSNSSDSSETILLLDDDPHFRQMLARLFSVAGYKVVEAQSAMVATALIAERRPALCIVDYRLPGMNGLSWIEHMRQAGVKTPMVISTATSLDGENFDELRKSLNIQLIVQKPINPATFLQQVEKFLAGQSQAAVPPADVIVSSLGIVADAEESNFLIELERELDVARGVYLRDTTKELNDFASRINFIDASDSIVVNEVRHLSHKIRGTSGSYRLTEVSKLAGMIEDLLSPGANDSCDENEYLSSAISALMFELRQSVENELKLRDPLALDAIKSGR